MNIDRASLSVGYAGISNNNNKSAFLHFFRSIFNCRVRPKSFDATREARAIYKKVMKDHKNDRLLIHAKPVRVNQYTSAASLSTDSGLGSTTSSAVASIAAVVSDNALHDILTDKCKQSFSPDNIALAHMLTPYVRQSVREIIDFSYRNQLSLHVTLAKIACSQPGCDVEFYETTNNQLVIDIRDMKTGGISDAHAAKNRRKLVQISGWLDKRREKLSATLTAIRKKLPTEKSINKKNKNLRSIEKKIQRLEQDQATFRKLQSIQTKIVVRKYELTKVHNALRAIQQQEGDIKSISPGLEMLYHKEKEINYDLKTLYRWYEQRLDNLLSLPTGKTGE